MPLPVQPSFADLGTPLHQVTFVVVDLETTGGSPQDSRITEFGAVKVRCGEVLGEFNTLVDPGQPIPTAISALTGITDAMVAVRPPVEAILPTFLEFCRGSALVAHNARFDVGFLNANCERLGYPRLGNAVVCTAALARRLVRDEVRNCRLATLAERFATTTLPTHRALADARATVEVFHALLERAGTFGVLTLEDLVEFSRVRNTPLFKSRRHLAEGLPAEPGVYAFTSASGEVLYVGKATDLRARVRSYFGNDDRRKIVDLLKETDTVRHWVCPTPLEAAVREVRLIAHHRPRFNRRSKQPEKGAFVKLTRDVYPRLSVVREAKPGEVALGPLGSRRAAELVVEAVCEVLPLRRCSTRITLRTRFAACLLAEIGRCLSPCDGSVDRERYAAVVATAAHGILREPAVLVEPLLERMGTLARRGRFEEAAAVRDRLRALVAAVDRTRRLQGLVVAGRLVASRPARSGAVEVAGIVAGRLVTTKRCAPAELPAAVAAVVAAVAADAGAGPVGVLDAEEVDLVSRWLDGRGVRVEHCDGTHVLPVAGGRLLADSAHRLARAQRSTGRPGAELEAKRTRLGVGSAA